MSQKRPEIQRAFAVEYSHQQPPQERAALPPLPPPQPQYDNRRYDSRPYDNKPVGIYDMMIEIPFPIKT